MTRIKLDDTLQDSIIKLCEGNPGALTVCARLCQEGGKIDPGDWLLGAGKLLSLDTLGIYGSSIWLLYKDICGQDLAKMVAVLRGWQLGFVSGDKIAAAIETARAPSLVITTIDPGAIMAKVQLRPPAFNAPDDQLETAA